MIHRQLVAALRMLLVLTALTGAAYPLAVTGVARALFPGKAGGSLVVRENVTVGSSLIAQRFDRPEYFHPRPSAAGDGYDASSSAGSNLGPASKKLLEAVRERVAAYRTQNGLPGEARVPVDAVTASASGLDPHISIANARLQAARVAGARGRDVDGVLALVDSNARGRLLGFLGEPRVNVLVLNLELDRTT